MQQSTDTQTQNRNSPKTWRVLKGNGEEIKIQGSKAIVVASGVLLFLNMNDDVVHTIASGNWKECIKET